MIPSETRGGCCTRPILLFRLLGLLLLAPAAWSQSLHEFAHSYAVVIGIRDYRSKQWPDLPYGRADADAMADYLKSQGFEVSSLFDAQATKRNIMETMIQLAKRLQPDDRVVFYFSGHGTSERNGDETWGYIVPYGATEVADYISNAEIQDLSRRMKTARHQLFLFDSCFSGQMITRSGGVSPDIPNYIEEVTKRIAREGFAAGGRDQSVLDSGPDGHSVFTSALLKGLACKADLNGDGFITFAELESFVIPLATNSYQTPAPGMLPGHEGGEFVFRSPCGRIGQAASPERLPKILVKRGDTDQLAEAKRLLKASQFAQAVPIFRASAAAGDAEGMLYLGIIHSNGWGVPVDYGQALQWYQKAAAAGNAEAMNILGFHYEWDPDDRDYGQARQWYEKAAATGYGWAMVQLAELFTFGHGVPQDDVQARQWYEKAAATGNGYAMLVLGDIYAEGKGVPKDDVQARQWYEKAAAAGNGTAARYLGNRYAQGQDYAEARHWYEKAAVAGDNEAMFRLGELYVNGQGGARDYMQARQWYKKAAEAGYRAGVGGDNPYWYEAAAATGDGYAMLSLGHIYGEGKGVPKDYGQARQWYEKAAASSDPMVVLLAKKALVWLPQK